MEFVQAARLKHTPLEETMNREIEALHTKFEAYAGQKNRKIDDQMKECEEVKLATEKALREEWDNLSTLPARAAYTKGYGVKLAVAKFGLLQL